MNYQNILCVGDSQTFGARTYGCYPLYLSKILTKKTPYQWRVINQSTNGYTAKDLYFQINTNIESITDTYQACILIGTNDVASDNDVEIFGEYYRQILRCFLIKKYKAVFCGEIPPIFPDGHIFFNKRTSSNRNIYNECIKHVIDEFQSAYFVKMEDFQRDCYEDSVHFNEIGNMKVAENFAKVIISI